MDKSKYYDMIDKLNNCVDYYENKDFPYTIFYLELANGDQIKIKFDEHNIPHLLGINIDYLRSSGVYTGKAYDILLDILDNPNKLANKIERGLLNYESIFSDHIEDKIKNFQKICGIEIFNIEFIVKYKKDKNLRSDTPLDDGYYIGYTNGDELNVVGFEKNDEKDMYYPRTSRMIKNDTIDSNTFLNRLFNNQSATIVEMLKKHKFDDSGNIIKQRFFYNNRNKIGKLMMCKRYTEMYNGVTDTISSNIFYVEKVLNLNEEKRINSEILIELTDKIKNKKIIDYSKLKEKYETIDDSIISLVGAYNDSLVEDNTSNYSYQDLITKYEECKERLLKQEQLITTINKKNQSLTERLNEVTEENNELKTEREQIKKILS